MPSVSARLAKLERALGGEGDYSGGSLSAEQWPGPHDMPGAPAPGLFRSAQLDNAPGDIWTGYGVAAAYHYSEADLEAIAGQQRRRLLLVVYTDSAVLP